MCTALVVGLFVVSWLTVNKTDAVQCASDGNRWEFKDCNYSYLLFTMHNVGTILLAAVVRFTLVKTTTKAYDTSIGDKLMVVGRGLSLQSDGLNFSDYEGSDRDDEGQPIGKPKNVPDIEIGSIMKRTGSGSSNER